MTPLIPVIALVPKTKIKFTEVKKNQVLTNTKKKFNKITVIGLKKKYFMEFLKERKEKLNHCQYYCLAEIPKRKLPS